MCLFFLPCKYETKGFVPVSCMGCVAAWGLHTFVLLCKVVSYLPVLITIQDTVGNVQVIGCHLVDTLGNAYERG